MNQSTTTTTTMIQSLFTQTINLIENKKKTYFSTIDSTFWQSQKDLFPNDDVHIVRLTNSDVLFILKHHDSQHGIHIFYEFLVGEYVNLLHTFLPCFIYTFEIVESISPHSTDTLFTLNNVQYTPFNHMEKKDNLIQCLKTCSTNTSLALLQEYNGSTYSTFHEYIQGNDFQELEIILFQIYVCLAYLDSSFAHNNLSYENIQLYKMPPDQFITFTYQQPLESITVKSSYIVKIINYSKSFFYRDTSCNSTTIASIFSNIHNHNNKSDNIIDIPTTHNKSVDLLLAHQLQQDRHLVSCPPIEYTGQCNDLATDKRKNTVYTVLDFYLFLKCYLENNNKDHLFEKKTCQATLFVYLDDSERDLRVVT